jgi:Fur family peroxide stress response transcriptional regulator
MMEKKTRQREAILKVLKGTKSHPTADWIYSEVRKEIPNISLGTVYRNLKLLSERGDILEIDLSGKLSRYDAYTENHYHFRCDKCDRVFDLSETVNSEINEKVARDTGFWVTDHRLEFRGLCKDCQKRWLDGK